MQLLLDRYADIEAKAEFGRTPLHLAAAFGYAEILKVCRCSSLPSREKRPPVQILLDRGADIQAIDNSAYSSLHFAAWDGHVIAVAVRRGVPLLHREGLSM